MQIAHAGSHERPHLHGAFTPGLPAVMPGCLRTQSGLEEQRVRDTGVEATRYLVVEQTVMFACSAPRSCAASRFGTRAESTHQCPMPCPDQPRFGGLRSRTLALKSSDKDVEKNRRPLGCCGSEIASATSRDWGRCQRLDARNVAVQCSSTHHAGQNLSPPGTVPAKHELRGCSLSSVRP